MGSLDFKRAIGAEEATIIQIWENLVKLFMNDIRQTEFCCAIYELGELGTYEDAKEGYENELASHRVSPSWYRKPEPLPKVRTWWDEQINEVLSEARSMGSGHLPKMIIFADVTGNTGKALPWARALRRKGYKVTRVNLGRNPKSGNDVEMFLWYTDKKVA